MTEKCPYCGKEVANSKALGSHIYYMHQNPKQFPEQVQNPRSKEQQEQFEKLFESCAKDRGLNVPKNLEKVERAIREIPPGVSSRLDEYRNSHRCATGKEELLKEIEELLSPRDKD